MGADMAGMRGHTMTMAERRVAAVRELLTEDPLLIGNRPAIRTRMAERFPELWNIARNRQAKIITEALTAYRCNLLEVRDGLLAVAMGVAHDHKDDPHLVLRAVEVVAKMYGLHRLAPKVQKEDFTARLDAEAAAWPTNVVELPTPSPS